ncbi:MAG: NADH-quinone oxidoreductase subunit N, partial [Acidimicrobiia bacterium]|nr:NADH-quinone oxidoreductase subunit N [Acidimicrobiia bacterium]
GLPLTSGFVAKFGVFRAAWESGFQWLVIVGVLASVVAFYVYLRLIVTMFMREPEGEAVGGRPDSPIRWALVTATIVTVLFGILPGPLLDFAGDVLTR